MNSSNIMILFSTLYLKIIVSVALEASYENCQLWRVYLGRNVSKEFYDKVYKQDVWSRNLLSIDFILNANETSSWDEFLRIHKMSYKILLKNVEENIETNILMNNGSGRRKGEMSWTTYPKSLKEIYDFLADVAASNKKYCTLSVIGKTAHNKEIKMLKLSNGNRTNPAILIDSGMHGREWTGIVSVLYFIEGIARNFSNHPSYITDNDWYLIPVLNPDGYEYTLSKDRLWKKNRRIFSGPCDGVDVNRNFDYYWCQKGGSKVICSPNYCGVDPFSEPESAAIQDVMSASNIFGYITVHSYGRKILFPWASSITPTRDIKRHIKVSKQMADAMYAVDRHMFRTASVARSGGESGTGMSIDWMYSQGATHSYILESRGEDIGGFFLNPTQLQLAMREVYAALVQFARIL